MDPLNLQCSSGASQNSSMEAKLSPSSCLPLILTEKNVFTMYHLKKPPDYVSFSSALTSYSIHDSVYPFITNHQKARFSPCEVETQLHYLLAMQSEHLRN